MGKSLLSALAAFAILLTSAEYGEIEQNAPYEQAYEEAADAMTGEDGEDAARAGGTGAQVATHSEGMQSLDQADYVWAYQGDVAFFEKDGKIGLGDSEGRVLHAAAFDAVGPFDHTGLAPIYVNGRTGRINRRGEVVVQPVECVNMGYLIYVTGGVRDVRDGALRFENRWRKTGFITLDGKEITPAKWDETFSFVNGFAYVKQNGKWNAIDLSGNLLLDWWWDSISAGAQGWATLSDEERKIYVDKTATVYAEFEADAELDGGWLLVKYRGADVRDRGYENISEIDETVWAYKKDGLWGLMTPDWEVVTEPRWDNVSRSCSYSHQDACRLPGGLLHARKDSVCGWIDQRGETVLDFEWNRIARIGENRWIGMRADGEAIVFDDGMERVWSLPPDDYRYAGSQNDGYVEYRTQDGYWGFFDSEGTLLSRVHNDQVRVDAFGWYSEGWTQVMLNGDEERVGFMHVDGTILADDSWVATRVFCNGYAQVKIGEKWGYIDTTGALVLPAVWDWSGDFSDESGILLAPVRQNYAEKHNSYINERGETVCGIKQAQ